MKIAVFCGARAGVWQDYQQAAVELGRVLAERQIGLVYGGASIGLMGAVADAVLEHGGEAYGVMPDVLHEMEIAHPSLTAFYKVADMHQRKAKMAQLADAFLVMPGGIGTMDEFFEAWTWRQLGYHNHPIGLLNTRDYFNPLLQFIDQMVQQHFLKDVHQQSLHIETSAEALVTQLQQSCALP